MYGHKTNRWFSWEDVQALRCAGLDFQMILMHWSNINKKKYLKKEKSQVQMQNGEQLPTQQDSRKGSGILEDHGTILRFNNVP